MASSSITTAQRMAVWRRYEQDAPNPGLSLDEWIAASAAEWSLPEPVVRRVIAEGSQHAWNALHERIQTFAQRAADMVGADIHTALATLRDGLTATRKRLLLDSQGRPKKDAQGELIWVETEDWSTRLSAARTLVEVHGGRAPQQFEVRQQTLQLNVDISTTDAKREIHQLGAAIRELESAIGRAPPEIEGAQGAGAAAKSDARDPKQAVLVDAVYEDQGRAGHAPPV